MTILYGVSFALHASLGAGVAKIEPSKEPERLAITVVEAPKRKEQAKQEPPPPPPLPPAKPKSKRLAPKAPQPAPEVAPAPAAAVPTFGIAMSGGVGMGGVAVPQGDSLHAAKEPVKRVAQAKVLAESKQAAQVECEEPASKPRPLSLDKPEYTEAARSAGIEGKVRVQLTVSADGVVTDAKVLESLDAGLDQAALTAARAALFEPAMHCGKPVEATFVVAIRFSL
jgi:protein TonB